MIRPVAVSENEATGHNNLFPVARKLSTFLTATGVVLFLQPPPCQSISHNKGNTKPTEHQDHKEGDRVEWIRVRQVGS